MKAVKGTINEALKQVANHEVEENYNRDLTLATKNVARLSNKEKGQDKKDYQAVSRALAQGNLGAVKKVIKGISTKEIQADLLNILVGYNALIAKMYPKATDSKGNLKSGLTVDKLIAEDFEDIKELEKNKFIIEEIKMSIEKIVEEAINNKPLQVKEELQKELYSRIHSALKLKEARGFDLEFQVKGCKNLKAFEADQLKDDYETTLVGLQTAYFDLEDAGQTQKISGDKILVSFTEEGLEEYGTNIKEQLKAAQDFCKGYTRFAKDTSKEIQKAIASGTAVKDIYPTELETNNPIDPYYCEAVRVGQADPKRPFVYSVRIK